MPKLKTNRGAAKRIKVKKSGAVKFRRAGVRHLATFGKTKKQNEARKKQVVVQLKEVKLRPRTEEHDYDVKIKKVREFLAESNKARITVMFRGREMSHRELGQKVLQRILEDLREVAVIESAPRMEGRQMFMILAPAPKILQRIRDQARQAAQQEKKADDKPPSKDAKPQVVPPEGGQPPQAEAQPQPPPAK